MYSRPRASTRSRYLGGVVQRRRKAVRTARLKLATPVAKLVDRRINRKVETKVAPFHYRRTEWDNLPETQARCCQLLRNILQGDDRSERDGSKISLQSMLVRGYIQIPCYDQPQSNDRSNIYFRLCCLSAKAQGFYPDVLANWSGIGNYYSQLLKPAETAQAPDGQVQDMWRDINRDAFTVHYDKVFNLSRGDAGGVVPIPAETTWRKDVIKHFRFRLKCKNKLLRYSTAVDPGTPSESIQPQNFAPFIVGWWAYTNGAPASQAAVPYVEYYVNTRFKDA